MGCEVRIRTQADRARRQEYRIDEPVASFVFLYIKAYIVLGSGHLSRPLHLQRLKSQHDGKSSWECPPPLIYPVRGICLGVYHAFFSLLSLGPLASPPGGYGFLSGSVRLG